MSLPFNDPRHGTANGYQNYRCRCDECREAWRIYHRELPSTRKYERKRHKPAEVWNAERAAQHGTESKYRAGCRCNDCRAAVAEGRRRRRRSGNVATHNANGYRNGCRCQICRDAASADGWRRYAPRSAR